MIVVTSEHTPFTALLTNIIKKRNTGMSAGTTKVDQARALGWRIGYAEGISEALAEIGTAERIKLIKPYSDPTRQTMVAGCYDYNAQQWLTSVLERWEAGEWKDTSNEEFFDKMWDEFYTKVVYFEKWDETLQAERKRAVLNGWVEPEPADADWLREERESLAAVVNPYDAALAKIGK